MKVFWSTLALFAVLSTAVLAQDLENSRFTVTFLDAQTADETTSNSMEINAAIYVSIYCLWNADATSGVVTFEESYLRDSGTVGWSSIATMTNGGANTQDVVHQVGAFRFIRVRISTVVGGSGSPSVTCYGQGRPAS